eukprot:TRINITY_DN5819_c0_g1_i1.p1 TRINITY_DN5819_c0_g1~~TRINITY_DN5819_c0_g1_i1.p1  ORF type:complete len:291 (+),score=131.36 TRINITY_DN5819_c0_g1_i1:64-936(+)
MASDGMVLGGTAMIGAVAGAVAGAVLAGQCFATRDPEAQVEKKKAPAPVQAAPTTDAVNFRHETHGVKTITFGDRDDAACYALVQKAFYVEDGKYMVVQRAGETVVALSKVAPGETLTVYDDDRTWKAVSDGLRKDGNEKFKAAGQSNKRADYVKALKLWREAAYVVPPTADADAVSTKCLALNNCAQVALKLGNNAACLAMCDDILAMEAGNVKALYRRGCAAHKLGPKELPRLESAQRDLAAAVDAAAQSSVTPAFVAGIKKELEEVEKNLKKAQDAKNVKLSSSTLD